MRVFLATIGMTVCAAGLAVAQASPFADAEHLCAEKYANHKQTVAAFEARGWTPQEDATANEDVLELMVFTLFYDIDPKAELTSDEMVERFKTYRSQALSHLGFDMTHRTALRHSDRGDISSLIVASETKGGPKKMHQTHCVLAGSSSAEADWLDKLAGDNRLPEDFIAFDPATLNYVGAAPKNTFLSGIVFETSSLMRLSHDRVASVSPRPLRYDLFFAVAAGHWEKQ